MMASFDSRYDTTLEGLMMNVFIFFLFLCKDTPHYFLTLLLRVYIVSASTLARELSWPD